MKKFITITDTNTFGYKHPAKVLIKIKAIISIIQTYDKCTIIKTKKSKYYTIETFEQINELLNK